jgi:hypothetical protein
MSNYIQSGSEIRVYGNDALIVHKKLPTGNYTVKQDIRGLYLERIDDFNVPSKLYGRTEFYAERILNTYRDRGNNTGVLLSGEKGSGKTMLARLLSILGAKESMPTITINQEWKGDAFNQLIQSIDQPCLLIFDEFEKVYDEDGQNEILTLFDGVYQTKKLIILTCNDRWAINQHMRNRPGRLYYMLEFKGLDTAFITDYCNNELKNKDHIDAICRIGGLFAEFNFDLLKAMVEELNRYNETPAQVLEMLNAKPNSDDYVLFKLQLTVDGKVVDNINMEDWRGIPIGKTITIQYSPDNGIISADDANSPVSCNPSGIDDSSDSIKVVFNDTHLRKVDVKTGNFIYENGNKRLELIRQRAATGVYSHLLA